MGLIKFENEQIDWDKFKLTTGLASPYANPGDAIYTKSSQKYQTICVCDGVSSSSDPHKSSKKLVDSIDNYFKNKKNFNLDEYLESLKKFSFNLSRKDLSSTLAQIVFFEGSAYIINVGDSQVVLYKDNKPVYTSWPQNIGFSNDDKNEKSHILVNWIGKKEDFRCELSKISVLDFDSGVVFSDGMLDLFNIPRLRSNDLLSQLQDSFKKSAEVHLLDDSSFVYFEMI